MKKPLLLCIVIAFAVILAGCSGGNVRNVTREIGTSEIYKESEIRSAMDAVVSHFSRNFEGCTMTRLWYDEEYSLSQAEDWAKQYDAEEAIVLRSCFTVDASGGDGSLNPNSQYDNWGWILVRNGGAWELKTWGYG